MISAFFVVLYCAFLSVYRDDSFIINIIQNALINYDK